MKLSIFNMRRPAEGDPGRVLDPGGAPPEAAVGLPNAGELRRQTLQWLLAASAASGGLVYLLGLPGMIEGAHWSDLVVYGCITAGFLLLALARRMAYGPRAAAFLGISLAGGVYMLAAQGLAGNGRLALLVFPLLAAFLLAEGRSARPLRLAALGLSVGGLAIAGFVAAQGYLPAGGAGTTTPGWLAAGLGLGLIGLVATLAFDRYLGGLEEGLEQDRDALQRSELERQRLEKLAARSSQDLERRLIQIRTAAEISRVVSSMLDLEQLLPRVCDLVKERFGLYYVGVFLIEAETDQAVLKAGTGEAGQKMIAEGHRLKVGGESMVGWATGNRRARIALDIGKDDAQPGAARFKNPHLPETRSELALPIISQRAVLGAMTIQSEIEGAFDQDDIVVLQNVADSLASAIENARLFAEIQSNLDEISALHRQYLRRSWMQALERRGVQEFVYVGNPAPRVAQPEDGPTLEAQALEIPIQLRGQAIGSLALEVEPGRTFSREERALVQAVVSQAALALENARLLDETRQRAEQESVAADISTRIWSSLDVETILRTALQELGNSLGAADGSIELWPERQPQTGLSPEGDVFEGRDTLRQGESG